ncbi:MAG: lanthionine synthetase C family protein [Candidatus Eisenbacteria bacterium]
MPILTDDEGAAADRSILQVALELGGEEWSPTYFPPGLAGGNAGMAIFYDELFCRLAQPEFKLRRDQHLDAAIDGLAESDAVRPNLYGGFTGVGWAVSLLSAAGMGQEGGFSEDDAHEELEDALLKALESIPTPAEYDLINGPVGWGLYALGRWPHPRAVRALELIVDFLESRAEYAAGGVRWLTAPEFLPQWQRENAPNGYYNLGISHGVPGICVLLAQTIVRGIRPGVSARLLEGAVTWILAQRIEVASGLSFPSSIITGRPSSPSRLAWCYGDLSVASAILVASQVSGNKSWCDKAISIAGCAAALPLEGSGAVDAGLCHGTSGIAHLFNRFYQATGDAPFRVAARNWFRATLKMRQHGIGPGGYAAWRMEPRPGWNASPGLLEGSAGIALALMAATGTREPVWDRFLMVSPVPAGTRRSR